MTKIIGAPKAPQISRFARQVVMTGAQAMELFDDIDSGVTFSSRWRLATAIDAAIMEAVEAFCEEQAEERGDPNEGIT